MTDQAPNTVFYKTEQDFSFSGREFDNWIEFDFGRSMNMMEIIALSGDQTHAVNGQSVDISFDKGAPESAGNDKVIHYQLRPGEAKEFDLFTRKFLYIRGAEDDGYRVFAYLRPRV